MALSFVTTYLDWESSLPSALADGIGINDNSLYILSINKCANSLLKICQ